MEILFFSLISLAGVFALVQLFRVKDTFARVINGTMVVSIAASVIASLYRIPEIVIDGYYLFAISCLLVVLYAFSDDDFSIAKKMVIVSMGGLQLLSMVFFLGRFPGVEIVFLGGLATAGIFFYLVTRDIRQYQNELSFLTVLMADGVIKALTIILAHPS